MIELVRVEMDFYGFRVYELINSYFYSLTSGNGYHLVCQTMPAYSSTMNPNMEETKDGQGYHHLPPTSHPWERGKQR